MENSKVIYIDNSNFNETIAEGVCLVDFFAEWCGPCRMIAPVIEQLAEENSIKICKADTEVNSDAAVKFGIRSIPAVLIFKDGTVVETLMGAQSKNTYQSAINKYL